LPGGPASPADWIKRMQIVPLWAWTAFTVTLLILLSLDLFMHRGGREATRGWAVFWSIVWVTAGLLFAIFIWIVLGGRAIDEYLAAYLIEKSLSLDNMFVFLIIFQTLRIPKANQRTALTWGIFGALIFRGLFIFAGSAAVERWSWMNYIFGSILLFAAVHAFRENPSEIKESRLVHWLSEKLPVSRDTGSRHFVIRHNGVKKVTPLMISIIALELTDILFAIDSVPAAFAVTRMTFLIYSSNAFAILGLRSLYAVLAELISGLRFLHHGLAAVLAFAALKIMLSSFVHIHSLISVAAIILMVGGSVWASLIVRNRKPAH
jgi:tellurite resistance protein TerC